jgi:hypothetical protein
MTEREPAAVRELWNLIDVGIPRAQLLGIVGNPETHFFGYHRSRDWDIEFGEDGANDYSVLLPQDKRGAGDCASALDVGLPADLMKTVSERLLAAGQDDDPRLHAMREFFGTVDGVRVIGWDRHNPNDAFNNTTTTSDSSHLTHIHLSFYRKFAEDFDALEPIASVMTGEEDMPTAEEIAEAVWGQVLSDGERQQPASSWLKQSRNLSEPSRIADLVVAELPDAPEGLTKAQVKAAVETAVRRALAEAGVTG